MSSGEPFILVGPEGCGKAMLLMDAFARERSTSVAVINCSAQTNATHAIQKLVQVSTRCTSVCDSSLSHAGSLSCL